MKQKMRMRVYVLKYLKSAFLHLPEIFLRSIYWLATPAHQGNAQARALPTFH